MEKSIILSMIAIACFVFKNGAKYNVEYGKGVSGGVVAVSGA